MPFEGLHPHLIHLVERPLARPVVDIFDIHMHSGSVEAAGGYLDAAEKYGVTRACDLTIESDPDEMDKIYGDFFLRCFWPRPDKADGMPVDWDEFNNKWVDNFDSLIASGASFLKLKTSPWPGKPPAVLPDDEHLWPLLEKCQQAGIPLQIHVAQPDCWWPKVYDEKISGPKKMYLDAFERVLEKFPQLTCISVHMASSAENPEYVEYLFRKYPNFHVDTSATKWVVREVSGRADKWREIFIRHADRICFGSDLVARSDMDYSYYASRLHVQRLMWESDYVGPSPIIDADGDGGKARPVEIRGLNLPDDVLTLIYRDNARRIMAHAV